MLFLFILMAAINLLLAIGIYLIAKELRASVKKLEISVKNNSKQSIPKNHHKTSLQK